LTFFKPYFFAQKMADTLDHESCHIISWNVAGFKTTLGFLDKFVDKGFEGWMKRQKADIVCLQEVKLSKKIIADEPKKYCANLNGFDTFWAFNDGSGGQRSGLNGVTTFVRKGITVSADCAPLGDPELDAEGRLVPFFFFFFFSLLN
jgi:exonuclease III